MSDSSTRERSWIVDFLSTLLLAFCIGIATSVVLGAAVVLMAGEARGAEGAQLIETVPMTPSEAQLAQVLLQRAWTRALAGERQPKPWPWADTWPVARLRVPAGNIDLFILAGANGRAIAFGPGHMFGTALPGEEGNSVIGGHRDTHLGFLRGVKPGTEIDVQRPDGAWRRYRVQAAEVLDKSETWVTKQDGWTRLTLVTCWPFDALRAGGPLRYVVFADAIGN